MNIIAFILKREEIIRILKHLALWPIVYPETKTAEASVSSFNFKLLRKLSI
jgi:hypothetical protein